MKLYEFTVTDNLNLSESKILEDLEIQMVQQAIEDEWAGGYTFKQSQEPEILPTGEKRYHFVVYGELLESARDDGSAKPKSSSHGPSDDVAAHPIPEL